MAQDHTAKRPLGQVCQEILHDHLHPGCQGAKRQTLEVALLGACLASTWHPTIMFILSTLSWPAQCDRQDSRLTVYLNSYISPAMLEDLSRGTSACPGDCQGKHWGAHKYAIVNRRLSLTSAGSNMDELR